MEHFAIKYKFICNLFVNNVNLKVQVYLFTYILWLVYVCQEHLLKTIGRHADEQDMSNVAIDSVLQQYQNEVSTLMDQLHGARERQMRVLLEKLDDSKRQQERSAADMLVTPSNKQ